MKKLKLFLVTLLTFVLPLTVWADGTELRDINCTFSGATYGVAGETYATGTLTTTEGNDWIWNAPGEYKSPIYGMTEVDGVVCLSAKLRSSSLELTSDFSVPGNIQDIFLTVGGNIGTIQVIFGDNSFTYALNYPDNKLHSMKFNYEGTTVQSTLPQQRISIVLYPKDENSNEPMYLQYLSITTKVMTIGKNSIVSDIIGFDADTYTLLAEDKAYDWKMALPYSGATLEDAAPATWNDEQCLYMRVTSSNASYTNLTFISAFPVLGKVKKIIVKAGGDLGNLSYTKEDGEKVYSEDIFSNVPYYKDMILDFGEGLDMQDNLKFCFYVGRNTFLKSITLVMEDDAMEMEGLTSTFFAWDEWDITDSFKVGSMKTKEDTPWLAFIYPPVPVYMTSIQFGEDAVPEECMLIGDNDGKQLDIELQNQFTVTGPVRKIIVRYTGHIETIAADIVERGISGASEQFIQVTPHERAGFTDAELVFDGTIEYTDADIRMFMRGSEPVFLKSITIVQDDNGGGGDEPELSGKCGDNLEYALTKLNYTVYVWDYDTYEQVEAPAYRLTITGTGDMYDYDFDINKVPWDKVNVESITEIELPDGMTHVGDCAFYGSYQATVNKLPDALTSIGTYAFYNLLNWQCEDLRLPNNLTSVGAFAFIYGWGFKNLYLPASLTSIGDAAFSAITTLENFYVDEANPVYKADGNAIIEKATNTLVAANINTVIPNYIETIGYSAFCNLRIGTIAIPSSVTRIGRNAFSSAYITSIDIPSSVTTLEPYAFSSCSKLLSVTIGSGVTTIDSNVFYGSTNILDVYCYADPDALIWASNNYDARSFKPDKMTQMHVCAADLEKWQEKFAFLNVTFVGDLPENTISPITEETVLLSSSLEGKDLSDNTVNNIYYNLDASTGNGYRDGYIYITQTTDISLISDGNPGSEDVRDNFTGIILKVGPGKGVIVINARSIGKPQLAVRIGDGTPTYASHNERWETYISYNVTEPTYVYVYAVGDGAALVRAYGNGEEDIYNNVLLIYGISVYPGADEDGIQTIDNEQLTNDNEIYDLSGKRLQGLPAKRGIYIVNGKKVLR